MANAYEKKIEGWMQDALTLLEKTLRPQLDVLATHKVLVVDGWDDSKEIRTAIARYLVGLRMCAIDAGLAIRAELAGTPKGKANVIDTVNQIIGDAPGALSADEITKRRNPWIAEGLWHLCMAVARQKTDCHPPGKVVAVNLPHAIPSEQGLDLVVLFRAKGGYGISLVETKAYRRNVGNAMTRSTKFFSEVDDGEHSMRLRQITSVLRKQLSKKEQDKITLRGQVPREEASGMSVMQWMTCLIETMREMPPLRVQPYMADPVFRARVSGSKRKQGRKPKVTPRTKLRDLAKGLLEIDSHPWDAPDGWDDCWTEIWDLVRAYMSGATYKEMAALYYGCKPGEIDSGRGTGKQLPGVFDFIKKVIEILARDAGCFVALNEHALKADDEDYALPESLQALPLCIRYGCNSLGVLGWFRFGYRQRHAAHALARSFGVPATDDDAERARAIARTCSRWADGTFGTPPGADPVLESVLQILRNAEE